MEVGMRIKARRKELGMSAETLAEKIGVSPATVYRYESAEIMNMRTDKLNPIAEALATTPAYLMGWEDPATPALPSNLIPVKKVRVPLLGGIAAGEPILAEQEYDTYVEADADMDCTYALHVDGDSMSPTICLGDVVFIRQQDDVDDGQIAAVLLDDSATLKRVYHIPNGLQLVSDNGAKYPPRIVAYPDYDAIRILGKAVAYKRLL